jgi:hypothetical protein
MTADHLNPPRKGAAADAAERAGENFTVRADFDNYLRETKLYWDSEKQKDRREAARKLADYAVQTVLRNLAKLASYTNDDYDRLRDALLKDISEKILEAMK